MKHSPPLSADPRALVEKPQNGLAGLKHWRHDLPAGLMVSLVSLPFSLGIAVASGAPPVAGLISAIIAGLIYPFLGGSYVTISGPAAGLAPVLFAGMLTLGAGNLEVGYPLLLGVICLTGGVQIILSLLKAARFSALFPTVVVEGMLAAIGLLIIAKQLPYLLAQRFEGHEFVEIILETPSRLMNILSGEVDVRVVGLGLFCLGLCFMLGALKARALKVVPPPLIVVVVGILLGWLLQLDPAKYMISVPTNIAEHEFKIPDFAGLLSNHALWWAVATIVITLTLIDGVESLATIAAIDRIDPFKRKSNPNRTLLAMGISNICSSLAGGLTIIPGGVKSSVCIMTGGRTLWANFYNAICLLIFLFLAKDLINMIPMSALAAIVAYIGYKLCAPKVWKHVYHIGSEQLLVFCVTVLVTLATDLLIGIFAGMATKLVVSAAFTWAAEQDLGQQPVSLTRGLSQLWRSVAILFRNPVIRRETQDGTYHLYVDGPMVCFNSLAIHDALASIPSGVRAVHLHLLDGITLIDHTSCDHLLKFVQEFEASGRGSIQVTGLGRLFMRSHHESCMRVDSPNLSTRATAQLSLRLLKSARRFLRMASSQAIASLDAAADGDELARVSMSHINNHPRDLGVEMDKMSLEHSEEAALCEANQKPALADGSVELVWMSLSDDDNARAADEDTKRLLARRGGYVSAPAASVAGPGPN